MKSAVLVFFVTLYKKTIDNELIQMANALSFKLIISLFPFLVFLMSLLGYLKIDYSYIIQSLLSAMPSQSKYIVESFVSEIFYEKHFSILSSSFLIALFSASSGFFSAIKGLNKVYEIKENRGYFKLRFICLVLVLIFSLLIFLSLMVLVFSDRLIALCIKNNILVFAMNLLDSFSTDILMLLLLFVLISIIYIIAVNRKFKIKEIVPGSVFTVGLWLVVSKLFNLYVNNFAKFSAIYGSIGGIFIFFYWINLIAIIFLVGGQINAVLIKQKGEFKA